jgi:hypothetical protein
MMKAPLAQFERALSMMVNYFTLRLAAVSKNAKSVLEKESI